MLAKVKFHCKEIVGSPENGEYDIPEGSTVKDFMDFLQQQAGETIPAENFESMVYMVNGKPAQEDTLLTEGAFMRVLYKILGG